ATAPAPAAGPGVEVTKPPLPAFDSEEFRRQVMEEVRKELQKAKDEVKQETAWVEQDSQARVQDSEAVEALKQRVNLFQPHGYLHNDGNCLDCDFGDTYDRIAFAPREFKGHHLSVMLDLLDKGQTTTGDKGELGRTVDLDTLDDGYRLAVEVTRVDTPEEVKR